MLDPRIVFQDDPFILILVPISEKRWWCRAAMGVTFSETLKYISSIASWQNGITPLS
jgi:hypothetical protein